MGLSLCLIVLQKLILRLLLVNVFVANYICFASVQQPHCHNEERSALLQLKHGFLIDKSVSHYEGAYPKFLFWNSSRDCCLWDGIHCDAKTGHVIDLDLSSSCLFGSINSHSSIFNLVHLQMLDLSDNHFNFSQIPAEIGKLSGLTYLNLSGSAFYGQVPLEISNLTKLSSLSLSSNFDPDTKEKFLHLKNPNFNMLVENLTRLEILVLSSVNISSEVPPSLANFTFLTTLLLTDCELHGYFPPKIFQLPKLQSLSVKFNEKLTGRLPEFHQRSRLATLRLGHTMVFGSLPSSIENLHSLEILDLYDCNFSGSVPSSLGKLTKLTFIDFWYNQFEGEILSSLGNLTKLTYLSLQNNNFSGRIPSSLQNLNHLEFLSFGQNLLTGPIPPWMGNLTQLSVLGLSENQLNGPVPESFWKLTNLKRLFLDYNNLDGNLKFDMFLNMKNLTQLQLGDNNFTSLIFGKTNKSATVPKLKVLEMSACNLREFPDFLKHQNELEFLTLVENRIIGQIPNWMGHTSTNTLKVLDLSSNLLNGFDQFPAILPWVNLVLFDISHSMFQGPLPIPPPSIIEYVVSDNMLFGEVPPNFFCSLSNLSYLYMSDNNLVGTIPPCLVNSASGLMVLSLRNNSFHGNIPQFCSGDAINLRMIDLSYNQLQGRLPRSLSNCLMLEGIMVSKNQLHDSFPSWLGSLSELKILMLHQNGFYGSIGKPKKDSDFSSLLVLDMSSNSFIGQLPSDYIFNWKSMQSVKPVALEYLSVYWENVFFTDYLYYIDERYKIRIMYKGITVDYNDIQNVFAFIDLSDNRFEGEISDLFGSLKALYSLNFSNNMLTGCIPSSLGNLIELESLDLSRNNLSCHIPQELQQLGFLSSFNVSHNNLTGPIPQGKQFDTFDATSFDGNPELCGGPLSKKCGNPPLSPSPPPEENHKHSESLLEENWICVLAGCIGGLVVGVVLAEFAMKTTYGWLLVEMVYESKKRKRKMRRGRRT